WPLVPSLGVLIRIIKQTWVMRRLRLACAFETSGNEGSVSETQMCAGVEHGCPGRAAAASERPREVDPFDAWQSGPGDKQPPLALQIRGTPLGKRLIVDRIAPRWEHRRFCAET